jgi:hypothetical protein
MSQSTESKCKALVLEAFDTLFNKRDYATAERLWSPNYIQHSAHIEPGREGHQCLPPVLSGHHGAPGSRRDGVVERQHVLQPRQDRRGCLTRARACSPLSGYQVVWKPPGSLQDSDQGGRSAAHAAKFLLRPAGLSRGIPERKDAGRGRSDDRTPSADSPQEDR